MLKLKDLRSNIKWFENNKDLVYLDSAATNLKPIQLLYGMEKYVNNVCTNPHNNDSNFAHQASEVIEELRAKLAKLLNTQKQQVVFTFGATVAFNTIALGIKKFLKKGDEIVLTNGEHSANLLCWIRLAKELDLTIRYVEIDLYSNNLDAFLKAINNKTKVVAFANEFNLFGKTLDANLIAKAIKEINDEIFVLIDGVQYLSHYQIDLSKEYIDCFIATAHKMLGPSGLGYFYLSKKWINKLDVVIVGGGSNSKVNRFNYTLLENHLRYECGTPNILGIYGFNEVIDYYFDEEIETHIEQIQNKKLWLEKELLKINDLVVLNKDIKASSILFYIKGVSSQDLAHYLGQKQIILRSGMSCAKLAHEIFNYDDFIRASIHFYTNEADLVKLINTLKGFDKSQLLNGLF